MLVKEIARKEFIQLTRDGRFRWTALIVLSLLFVALGIGWKNFTTVKRDKEAAQADSRRTWEEQGDRNPHSAAHYGVYAYKPKMPLSLIDSGLDNFSGNSIWVEAHYQNPARNRPAEDATALQRFGELTAAGILQLLLPLVIIFLTFDAFGGERASGTLRQILANGVPRRQFVLGKLLGVLMALMLLLVPSVLIGVSALGLTSGVSEIVSSGPRLALLCVGYLLYFIAFIGIALTVSALARNVRTALVALLAIWIFGCLVVPRLAGDVASATVRTPTGTEFWAAVKTDLKNGIDGHNSADQRTKELEQKILAQYGVTKKEDLPINFSGIALQAGEEYGNTVFDKHYGDLKNRHVKQENYQLIFGLVTPFLPMRAFSMAMAGTDLRHQHDFTDAVEQYRRALQKVLNDDLAFNSNPKTAATYKANKALWEKTPEFTYRAPATSWALGNQLGALGLLGLWSLSALALSFVAANRMRVF